MCSALAAAADSHKRRPQQIWRGGRSLTDMRSLTGLSISYIVRALSGQFMPGLDKLKLLARAMDKSVHELAVELQITDPAPLLPRTGFYPKIYRRDINQAAVSRATGLSPSYVCRILSADDKQRRLPRPDDLAILAKHFRCSMDHLIACWHL